MTGNLFMVEQYREEQLEHRTINLGMISRLGKYIMRYRLEFAATLAVNFLAVLPGLIEPHILKVGIDRYISAKNFRGVVYVGIFFLFVKLFNWLITMFNENIIARLGQKVLNEIRKEVFNHVQRLSMDYFDRTPQGRIIARADTDIDSMEHIMTWGAVLLFDAFVNLLGALYFMSRYSAKLCLSVSFSIVVMLIATNIFRKAGIEAYRKVRETSARITSYLAESISGIRIIQSFVRENANSSQFSKITGDHMKNNINSAKIWHTYFPFINFTSSISIAIVLFYGGSMVAKGELTIGELNAYIMYIGMVFWPIFMMGELYNNLLATSTSAERIFQLLDTKPRVVDSPRSRDISIDGDVVFDGISFGYSPETFVLKNISFRAEKGQVIALVGRTGAGKTTIVNLLAKFYEPQKGRILVDGADLADIKLSNLRSQTGIVPQDSFLFSDTIMNNLKFGRDNVPDEEALRASRETNLHGFIEKLSDGYKTVVQERGTGLSEGERQLICITRALIADPRLLILDEATSAIDTHTETLIQAALEKLLRGRTCFIIAQRLSTIQKADNILVIKDGELIEQGRHEQLFNAGGYYKKMYLEFTSRSTPI